MSSANNLHLLLSQSGKSLKYIKNKRGTRMEPRRTPARISNKEEHTGILNHFLKKVEHFIIKQSLKYFATNQ